MSDVAPRAGEREDATPRTPELVEAEAYIEKLRGPLLYHFGTTDPDLLAEVWGDATRREDLPRCDEDTHYWLSHAPGDGPRTGALCKCGAKRWTPGSLASGERAPDATPRIAELEARLAPHREWGGCPMTGKEDCCDTLVIELRLLRRLAALTAEGARREQQVFNLNTALSFTAAQRDAAESAGAQLRKALESVANEPTYGETALDCVIVLRERARAALASLPIPETGDKP